MVLVRSYRRDIFPVAPERCNKGNRRRLHAGKYLTTTHHLSAGRSGRRSEMAEPRKACPKIDPHFRWRTKSKAGSKRRIFTNDSCHGIRLWSPPDSFVIHVFVYLTCTTYLSFRSLTNWKHDKNVPSIYTVAGNSWTKNRDCAPFKLLTLLGEYIKCSTVVFRRS